MMMIWTLAAAAGAAFVQPGTQLDRDLRCVASLSIAGDSAKDDEKTQAGLMLLMMYYIGRIDAQAPNLDLEGALRAVVSRPGYLSSGMAADLQRCSKEMENRGAELQAVGDALSKTGN